MLDLGTFVTRFADPLAQLTTPSAITDLLAPGATPPFSSSETVRSEVRNLLREGGFKPSGRSKPASEYLIAAHAEACNVGSPRDRLVPMPSS